MIGFDELKELIRRDLHLSAEDVTDEQFEWFRAFVDFDDSGAVDFTEVGTTTLVIARQRSRDKPSERSRVATRQRRISQLKNDAPSIQRSSDARPPQFSDFLRGKAHEHNVVLPECQVEGVKLCVPVGLQAAPGEGCAHSLTP